MAMEVTEATFQQEVAQSPIPVLVDFWAPWCGPCRMLAPVMEQLADEQEGKAKVVKVNVDDNPELAKQFQVYSIPTVIAFKNGQETGRRVGLVPTANLTALLYNSPQKGPAEPCKGNGSAGPFARYSAGGSASVFCT